MRVARYDSPTVQNAPVAVPQASPLGPEAFGVGIARGANAVADVAWDVVQQEQRKANQKALYDFRTGIDNDENTVAFGDDENEGFLSLRGEDAGKHLDVYIDDFKNKLNERLATAANDEQRQAFDVMGKERLARIEGQFRRHANVEFQSSVDASQKALEESTLRNIGNYYNDDIRFGQELAVLRQTIIDDADNKGQAAEVKKYRLDTMTSKAYTERLDRLMLASPSDAKQFLDDNKDLMTSDDVARYERAIKPLVSSQEGLTAATEIFSASPDAGIDVLMKQMRERFKDKPDSLKHGEVELKSMVAERKAAHDQEVKAAEDTVYGYLAKVQLAGGIPKRSDVPADAWAQLAKVAPEKINQITDEMRRETEHQTDRARQEQDRQDAKVTTERLTTWSMLKLNPDLLKRTNLDSLLVGGKLAKNQYQDLVTDQLQLKNDRTGAKAETVLSNKQAVDGILLGAGIKEKDKPEQYMKFYEALNGRLKNFRAETGNEPKQDDIIKASRGLLTEVNQDGFLWNPTRRAFDVDQSKVVVPKEDREAITLALKKNGRPVSDEAIRQIYLEKTIRKGGK